MPAFRLRYALARFDALPLGRHPVALSALILFAVALAIRALQMAMFPYPAYPDSFYYQAVARSIAGGQGANIPYLWSFLDVGSIVPAAANLPIPAFAHWMPLASLVQVPFIWLLGPTDLASGLPFVILAAALAPFTYLMVRDLAGRTALPLLAGTLVIIPGYVAPYLTQADNFALFALLAGGSLWLVGRIRRGGPRIRSLLAAGALAGLAYLSRTDGVLVSVAVLAWGSLAWLSAKRARRSPAIGPKGLIVFAAGAVAVASPWLIRQLLVFGTISVSASSGRILWIRNYNELFSADGPLTPAHLFSWDLGSLWNSRLDALSTAVLFLVGAMLLFALAPFALAGLRRLWRKPALRPLYVYAGLFLTWSVLVAAPHLASGNFLHSATALLPLMDAGVGLGLVVLLAKLGRRFKSWPIGRTLSRLAAALILSALIGTTGFTFAVLANWSGYRQVRVNVVGWLEANAPEGAIVMSSDPGSIWSLDPKYPGIQSPTSDLAIIEAALSRYHVRYLLLEKQHIVPTLLPLLDGQLHPDWLSEPLFSVPDPADTGASARVPLYAIYGVLTDPPSLAVDLGNR